MGNARAWTGRHPKLVGNIYEQFFILLESTIPPPTSNGCIGMLWLVFDPLGHQGQEAMLPASYDVVSNFPGVQMVTMRHVLAVLVVLSVVSSSNAELILDTSEPSVSHKAHELHEHHAEFIPSMQKHPVLHDAHELHEHHVYEEVKSREKRQELNWDPQFLHRVLHHFPHQTGHGTSFGGGSGPAFMNGFGSGDTPPGGGSGGGAKGGSIDSNPYRNPDVGGDSLTGGKGDGDHPFTGGGGGNDGAGTPGGKNPPSGPGSPAAIPTPEPSGIIMLALGSLLVGGSWLLRSRFQVAT